MYRFIGIFLVGILVVCQAQLSKTRSSDCGDNETYQTCGTACEPSCDTPSPSICTLQCVIGCQCDDGYVRNSNDQCVLYEQCTATSASNSTTSTPNLQQVITSTTSPIKCGANETYSDCHNPCTEAKCPTEGTTVAVACIAMCMQGCSCNTGYVRNNEGQCVESADCVSSTSANPCELVDCRFGMTCEAQNGKAVCVPVKPQSLTCASTLCMNGYRCVDRIGKPRCVREAPSITCSNVRCITPGGCAMVEPAGCFGEDCVAQPMCIQENRCHYTKCASTTECVLKQVTCIRAPCNPIAECVPKRVPTTRQKRSEESSECPINERMVPCRNACSEEVCNQKEQRMCTQECLYDGCACDINFYRHPNGTCVDQTECDKLGTARVFLNTTSCALVDCSSGLECEEVNTCDDNGTCTTQATCVKHVELNSTIVGCSNLTCPTGQTCQQLEVNCFKAPCDPIVTCVSNSTSSMNATQGCDVVQCESDEICQEDTINCDDDVCPVRVSCVKYVQVNTTSATTSTKCAANETFSECTNPCSESKCVTNTDYICTAYCSAGCSCATGYKRNTTGSCVESADCPVVVATSLNTTTCGVNETLTDCYNSCSEEKCSISSLAQCTSHCRVGCECSNGYVRSNDGNCYEEGDCPDEQICGQNEDYRCTGCDANCTNPYPDCETKNCTKSCQCAIGFVRLNDNCVTFKQCSSTTTNNITCPATEVYTDCVPKCAVTCSGKQTCDDDIDEDTCIPGCVCQAKYKRDSNGDCVHNRQCYKSTDCDENEEWVKCKDTDLTCAVYLGSTTKSPTQDNCLSGCACASDYARNTNGTCIPTSQC